MKRIALIPSYEPDNKLIDLVNNLAKNEFEIIVVNDGSSKEYDTIFESIKDTSMVLTYNLNFLKICYSILNVAFL